MYKLDSTIGGSAAGVAFQACTAVFAECTAEMQVSKSVPSQQTLTQLSSRPTLSGSYLPALLLVLARSKLLCAAGS